MERQAICIWEYADTPRVLDLRRRVRDAMEVSPAPAPCPERIDDRYMGEPLPVRKVRAIAKLAAMPAELRWPCRPSAMMRNAHAPAVSQRPRGETGTVSPTPPSPTPVCTAPTCSPAARL